MNINAILPNRRDIFQYNNLIFSPLQKSDSLATRFWSTATGYTDFKNTEFYKSNLGRPHIVALYNENESRFRKLLWTRDVMSAASLIAAGICLYAGSLSSDLLLCATLPVSGYLFILLAGAAAIRLYTAYSNNTDIVSIRRFPRMAERLHKDEDIGLVTSNNEGLIVSNSPLLAQFYPLGQSPIGNY